jgi:hypothetical protein
MAQLIKIDLSEQLGEGQYVEIRNPKVLPWGEQRKLQAALKDNSVESQIEFAEQLAVSLAKNGNVFDENGNPVTFPLTSESLANVPAPVIEAIAVKFAEIRGQGANVPKK